MYGSQAMIQPDLGRLKPTASSDGTMVISAVLSLPPAIALNKHLVFDISKPAKAINERLDNLLIPKILSPIQ